MSSEQCACGAPATAPELCECVACMIALDKYESGEQLTYDELARLRFHVVSERWAS